MFNIPSPRNAPLTWFVAAFLVAMFMWSDVSCIDRYPEAIKRRLQHANLVHLLTNLSSLFVTGGKLEVYVGTSTLGLAMVFLLATEALIDNWVDPTIDGCGVGFSGVLLGLSVWELQLFGFERSKLTVILAAILGSQIRYGHLYGVVSGILWSILYAAYAGPIERPETVAEVVKPEEPHAIGN